ncbi:hypothetical protein [Haladaptatus sp. DFWS20]|uniref:hypothetical protein n=1 Tax=Haladaptatus sp. DFWS20 TaxID=3403467 RepID=UPI003EBC48CA
MTASGSNQLSFSIPLRNLPNRSLTADELCTLYKFSRVVDVLAGPAWEPILPDCHKEYDAFVIVYAGSTTAWILSSVGWQRVFAIAGRCPIRAAVAVEEAESHQSSGQRCALHPSWEVN